MRMRSSTKVKPRAFGGAVRISNAVVITNVSGLVVAIHKSTPVRKAKALLVKENILCPQA
jgi:hypothetical protein